MSKAIGASNGSLPATQELYRFGEAQVRIVIRDGEPWFVAADVCRALSIVKTDRALTNLDEDERRAHTVSTSTGAKEVAVINESGLYSLILRSRKPEAKKFKRWVTSEVLPAIRKRGSYVDPKVAEELETYRVENFRFRALLKLHDETKPALRAPKSFDLKTFTESAQRLEAKVEELRRATVTLASEVVDLGKLPKPELRPGVVPRRRSSGDAPYGGKLAGYDIHPSHSVGLNAMAVVSDDRKTVFVAFDIWFGWLAGDPQSGKLLGSICDHYGLRKDVVGRALARYARR